MHPSFCLLCVHRRNTSDSAIQHATRSLQASGGSEGINTCKCNMKVEERMLQEMREQGPCELDICEEEIIEASSVQGCFELVLEAK